MDSSKYPRNLIGYGENPIHPKWPNNAKLAVQIVINYEEGGENCIIHGDKSSEHLLSEIVGAVPYENARHMNMESIYEYGSRSGFWRLYRVLTKRNITCTVFAVGMALERNPEAAKAMVLAGWEVASHGYRWIDYQNVDEKTEREHIQKAYEINHRLTGKGPIGIYQGKPNQNTRKLVVECGKFLYDSDAYNDDLPYWDTQWDKPHLIIPYTLCNNDMRFVCNQGFNSGDQFFTYLKDAFDVLYEEGIDHPKMMSIGLHCRIVGQPGRIKALERFLDYIQKFNDIWICRREEIANHWYKNHYPKKRKVSS